MQQSVDLSLPPSSPSPADELGVSRPARLLAFGALRLRDLTLQDLIECRTALRDLVWGCQAELRRRTEPGQWMSATDPTWPDSG